MEEAADQLASFNLSDAEAQGTGHRTRTRNRRHFRMMRTLSCGNRTLNGKSIRSASYHCRLQMPKSPTGLVVEWLYVRLANKRTGELEPLQTEREQRRDYMYMYRRWRNTNAVRSVECQFPKLTQNASNDYKRGLTKVILRPCSM